MLQNIHSFFVCKVLDFLYACKSAVMKKPLNDTVFLHMKTINPIVGLKIE